MSLESRSVRVFLSSTFRDFGEERDLLVKRVFPSLRQKLKERAVELVDVDLRWGITVEQAERGEVLPICLAEIDRARPFFIGLLGERYGWIPAPDHYPEQVLTEHPWLKRHQGGKSVTELEFLHGVLNKRKLAGRAFFYVRSAAYAKRKGGDYVAATSDDKRRQDELKTRIRETDFPVVNYRDPEALAKRLEQDLWDVLDQAFPADAVPDAYERESRRHEAYAQPRQRLYLGGQAYTTWLTQRLDKGQQWILIEGASGGGKSALLANALQAYGKANPKAIVHEHYLAASADAADPVLLVRRLIEGIQRRIESVESIPSDPQKLLNSLPIWLAYANSYAQKHKTRWIIALDALNSLRDRTDLRWLPDFLPKYVQLVVSCLPGVVCEALKTKAPWRTLHVTPLTQKDCRALLIQYLGRYNKTLPKELIRIACAHPLSTNPLFLRTLAEELRLFGSHEQLRTHLDHCLKSKTVDALFAKVLKRVEVDCGESTVRFTLSVLWASRAGLSEKELLQLSNLKPAQWSLIRNALSEALMESGGRLTFAHDYLRSAVRTRYLATALKQKQAHVTVAQWFSQQPIDQRAAEELPYQWQQAEEWKRLKATLTTRAMFKVFCDTEQQQALLSYWLVLESRTKADLESDYAAAWQRWKPQKRSAETSNLANTLSFFLREAGRYKAFTTRLARLSLAINKRERGPEHPSTGNRLSNLAIVLQAQGDYAPAEPLYRRALAIAEKAEGPQHRSTGICLNNLAGMLSEKGDYAGAEPLYLQALTIIEKAEGPDHPLTVTCLNNLAQLRHSQHDYAGAEPLCRRALAIAEKVSGPEHKATATALANLGALFQVQGDYASAVRLFRRALTIYEKAQGPEHPSTGTCLENLAFLLKTQKKYAHAELLYRRALAIAEKAEGPTHPSTAKCLLNLARLLEAQRNYSTAESLYRQALAIAKEIQSLPPEWFATCWSGLGTSLVGQGKYSDAVRHNRHIGMAFETQEHYSTAELYYRESLSLAETVFGHAHEETADILFSLVRVLEANGEYVEAEIFCRRLAVYFENCYGPNTIETATAISRLADLLTYQRNYSAAEYEFRRVLDICDASFDLDHPLTLSTLEKLVTLFRVKGNLPDVALFKRLLRIKECLLGLSDNSVRQMLQNYGVLLRDSGSLDESSKVLHEALLRNIQYEGPESEITASTLSALGQLKIMQGRYDEAKDFLTKCLHIREKTPTSTPESLQLVKDRLALIEERSRA